HSRLLQNAAAADPWAQRDGWRIAGTYEQTTTLLDGEFAHDVSIKRDGATWALAHGDSTQTLEWDAQAVDAAQYQLRIRLDGADASGTIICRGGAIHVFADGTVRGLKVHGPVEPAQDAAGAHGCGLTAPMPGKIIASAVKPGD